MLNEHSLRFISNTAERRRRWVNTFCVLLLVGASAVAEEATQTQDAATETQINLKFERRPGEQTGGSVFDVGKTGHFDDEWVTCPSITFDGQIYRMWYSSFYDYNESLGPRGIGLATSQDGMHWTRTAEGKPVLVPGPVGALDDGQVMGPEVLFDGTIYRMWYTGQPRQRHSSGIGYYRIFLATSRDGLQWKRENSGRPVLDPGPAGAFDSVQVATPSILRDGEEYRMWYAAWAPETGHVVCTANSRDGVSWQKTNGGRPVEGLMPAAAYGPAVTRIGKRYVMLYMATRAKPELYGAISSDGVLWNMLSNGHPVIPRGGAEDFDGAIVGHPFLMKQENRLRVWYTGYRREPNGQFPWRLRVGTAEATLETQE